MRIQLLAASIVLSVFVIAAEEPALPQEVQDYVETRISCNHLAGEEYTDPSRKKVMAQGLMECGLVDLLLDEDRKKFKHSKIDTIDMQEKRLRKKYKGQPRILGAMDDARGQLP